MRVKQCNKCSETKSLTEFYKNPNVRDGRQGHCKKCHSIMLRKPQSNYRNKMKSGVYGLFSNETCLYVGESSKLTERISQHKSNLTTLHLHNHKNLYKNLIDILTLNLEY